jgi:hypothetical protein
MVIGAGSGTNALVACGSFAPHADLAERRETFGLRFGNHAHEHAPCFL